MQGFLHGFVWAGKGVLAAVRRERNFRFHLCAAVYVTFFSQFYTLARAEGLLLVILIAGVLALELLNSSLECVVDYVCPQQNKMAALAKDMAAGAVLVFCIGAAVCGVWLFWDTAVFAQIFAWFNTNILRLVLLVASVVATLCFVFIPGRKKEKA